MREGCGESWPQHAHQLSAHGNVWGRSNCEDCWRALPHRRVAQYSRHQHAHIEQITLIRGHFIRFEIMRLFAGNTIFLFSVCIAHTHTLTHAHAWRQRTQHERSHTRSSPESKTKPRRWRWRKVYVLGHIWNHARTHVCVHRTSFAFALRLFLSPTTNTCFIMYHVSHLFTLQYAQI